MTKTFTLGSFSLFKIMKYPSKNIELDGISLVGLVLLAVFVGTVILALVRSAEEVVGDSESAGISTPPATLFALLPITPTIASSPTTIASQTSTTIPTSTPSPTFVPSDTPTELPTATPTLLNVVTSMATLSASETPLPTASPTPPLLPTPYDTYSTTVRVPILMYHYISIPPADADQYRTDLSVTPENFRAQMTYLAQNGYTTIDLYDLSLAIVNKRELPAQPIIITIDDGYRDNYENAFPILQEFGFTATFFIITDLVDQGHELYMSWEMIKELANAGMRIEPHTKNHLDLRERGRDFLIWQILGSQQTVAHHIGYTPRYFAYPGGTYDDTVVQILKELDFWGSVITAGGWWHGFNDRYEWTRLRVRYATTMPEFMGLVTGGQ